LSGEFDEQEIEAYRALFGATNIAVCRPKTSIKVQSHKVDRDMRFYFDTSIQKQKRSKQINYLGLNPWRAEHHPSQTA
jgi:hypothetical protein